MDKNPLSRRWTDNCNWRPVAILLAAVAWQGTAAAFNATVTITATPGAAVNRLLLGNNVAWVSSGSGLVNADGSLNKGTVSAFLPLGAASLRYPGGTLADSYHWQDGLGPIASRGQDENYLNQFEPVVFGTNEFLYLNSVLKVNTKIITVNVPSGTAMEAADWVNFTNNNTLHPQMRADYWEIGNEPYLIPPNRPDLVVQPADFIGRFNNFATQMRKADPTIKVGLPLRTDSINNIWTSAYPGWNKTMLTGLTVPVDFIAQHYYMPYTNEKPYSDSDMYWAGMAAAESVAKDMATTTAQLQQYLGHSVPFGITEFNAMFTLHKNAPTDNYTQTLQGAVVVADMLRMFTQQKNVLFANFWSMIGDGRDSVVDDNLKPRASFRVLQFYAQLLNGNYLPISISAPTFTNNTAGAVLTNTLPLVTGVATADGSNIRFLLINKSMSDTANIQLSISGGIFTNSNHSGSVGVNMLTGDSPLADLSAAYPATKVVNTSLNLNNNMLSASIPPYSIVLYTYKLH